MRRLSFLFVSILGVSVRAETLQILPSFPPTSFLPSGEMVLRSGRQGVALQGLLGTARNGGSSLLVSGALPLGFPDSVRGSGWFVSGAFGYRPRQYRTGDTLAIGATSWEASVGRAIDFLGGTTDTGLRGYFDLGVRDDIVLDQGVAKAELSTAGYEPRGQNLKLGLRIGACNDPTGAGLVAQAPPLIGYMVQTALYYPVVGNGMILVANVEARSSFGLDWFRGGVFADATKYVQSQRTAGAEDLTNALAYGVDLEAQYGRYLFGTALGWTLLLSDRRLVASAIPFLKTTLSAHF